MCWCWCVDAYLYARRFAYPRCIKGLIIYRLIYIAIYIYIDRPRDIACPWADSELVFSLQSPFLVVINTRLSTLPPRHRSGFAVTEALRLGTLPLRMPFLNASSRPPTYRHCCSRRWLEIANQTRSRKWNFTRLLFNSTSFSDNIYVHINTHVYIYIYTLDTCSY